MVRFSERNRRTGKAFAVRAVPPLMKTITTLLLSLTAVFVSAQEFNPRQVVKPFPPIQKPEIANSEEAGKWVVGKELVLGVVVAGEARAYPINQLTNPTREIINDTLGDRSIAATW